MMQLIKGAEVFSSVGEKIGSLDRVVIDPETKEVTHLIVEKGILFATNKVVPIEYINVDVGDRIALDRTADELKALPAFEPSSYISLNQTEQSEQGVEAVYWYPSQNFPWWTSGAQIWYPKPKFVKAEKVIPERTVALREGAAVISKDGKHIGNIEQVIVEPEDHRATHIVIGEGIFLKEHKLIPTLWIREVEEDKVHLSVWSDLFDQLPEYEGQETAA